MILYILYRFYFEVNKHISHVQLVGLFFFETKIYDLHWRRNMNRIGKSVQNWIGFYEYEIGDAGSEIAALSTWFCFS